MGLHLSLTTGALCTRYLAVLSIESTYEGCLDERAWSVIVHYLKHVQWF